MAFPTLSAQQETNRKILEDIQLKKQLLAKGVTSVAIGNLVTTTSAGTPTTITQPAPGQMPTPQLMGPPSDFSQASTILVAAPTRTVFNPSTGNTFGFFIPQDSHYGNTFIPVLPRLDPLPTNPVQK